MNIKRCTNISGMIMIKLYDGEETGLKIFIKECLTSSSRASPVKYRTACRDKIIQDFINNLLIT